MSEAGPRIALIHALEESVMPIRAAFTEFWPEATTFDLLESSLAPDRALAGSCDESMVERFRTLSRYAAGTSGVAGSTQAILFTCSAFGPAIDAVKADQKIPVLKPNEAAFAEALSLGKRIGICVTFEPSLTSLVSELEQMAREMRTPIKIKPILVDGALAALKAGDGEEHDKLAVKACANLTDVDVLILGQFSLARAAIPLRQKSTIPILTTPHSAVRALRARLSTN
ncbi:aspartate/glutamate racemase family protein [Brucella anthropi]|uniref:Arylsulfatase n=1 Tax=Brucella anthropi TaxID=529 RepID=A0A6L3Z0R9_BRUAN|nr:aspartate/glutamate racemase family protein [Brucella anthropi]KAB2764279.1 hypothetical protein F9L04_20050 [Brucella anthropi]